VTAEAVWAALPGSSSRPDSEVVAKAKRRTFPMEYKIVWFGSSIVIEHRYTAALVTQIERDGLVVSR